MTNRSRPAISNSSSFGSKCPIEIFQGQVRVICLALRTHRCVLFENRSSCTEFVSPRTLVQRHKHESRVPITVHLLLLGGGIHDCFFVMGTASEFAHLSSRISVVFGPIVVPERKNFVDSLSRSPVVLSMTTRIWCEPRVFLCPAAQLKQLWRRT